MLSRKTSESGFTLVEMLVVVGIIGILVAIAIPVYLNQQKSTYQAAVQYDLSNIYISAEGEKLDNKFIVYEEDSSYKQCSEPGDCPGDSITTSGVEIRVVESTSDSLCIVGRYVGTPDELYVISNNRKQVEIGDDCSP